MPLILRPHEPLFQRAVLEVTDEIPVTPRALLRALRALRCSATAAPLAARVAIRHSVGGRWVVRWTGLQADRLRGVEVACDALDGGWDSTLLHFHCRGSLASRLGLGV